MRKVRRLACWCCFALAAVPPLASAQTAGQAPPPIPGDALATGVDAFTGAPAIADPKRRLRVPRHPFMAPNGASNIHNDAYQSDVYNRAGPLGEEIEESSALFFRECASVTFDRRGRIVTVCVGLDRPVLAVLDPVTLEPLSSYPLPPRQTGTGSPFQDFAGGGYFYLDHRDRAVVPTSDRRLLAIAVADDGGLSVSREWDLSGAIAQDDAVIAAMPDWRGRTWFASKRGVVGWLSRGSGKLRSLDTGERIGNSFAVDETGGVFIVTDAALYRFEGRRGRVRTKWRRGYPNVGETKPGQTQAGSGTTPTLMGRRFVAITDNADPMRVRVYKRRRQVRGARLVCSKRLFEKGASSTDQSLIATRRSIVAENNFGYTGPASTLNGDTTSPGLQRVDLRRGGGCRTVWRSRERAPSVVPKLSLGNGLVYTYTKPKRSDDEDAWYLTAVDFDTGATVWRALSGTGFGHNNNFAPVSLGPDGTAYVGVLGGLTRFSDGG